MKRVANSSAAQGRGKFDYDALVADRLEQFPFPSLWATKDLAREFGIGVTQRQHLSRALRRAGIQPTAKLPITDPVTKQKIRTRLWRLSKTKLAEELRSRDDLRREYYRQWAYYLARSRRYSLITQDLQQVAHRTA